MTNCSPSVMSYITTYWGYSLMLLVGRIMSLITPSTTPKGFAPLLKTYEEFFTDHIYARLQLGFARPVISTPGRTIVIQKRPQNGKLGDFYKGSKDVSIPKAREAVNMSSYNYLGFAEAPECQEEVLKALDLYGTSTTDTSSGYGHTQVHEALEQKVAEFVGTEDALIFGMGFATNSTVIPALVDKHCCVISDSLNHASLIMGVRASGAKVKVFRHNNMKHLENVIRHAIVEGHPRRRRPYKKILIIVEGVYSMEGEMCNLPEILALKKKYGCYLYMDEAHSIGATGPSGKGVAEYFGVNPKEIDIMMGTFTKSFGSVGGYIAGSEEIIHHLRKHSFSHLYATNLPVPATQIVHSAMKVMLGQDGSNIGVNKIKQLRRNENRMRDGLRAMGCEVIGDEHSPVMCVMIYNPGKMFAVSNLCLKRGVALVMVGAPATDLIEGRIRFCVSAAHTDEDIDYTLKVFSEVTDITLCKYKLSYWEQLKRIFI